MPQLPIRRLFPPALVLAAVLCAGAAPGHQVPSTDCYAFSDGFGPRSHCKAGDGRYHDPGCNPGGPFDDYGCGCEIGYRPPANDPVIPRPLLKVVGRTPSGDNDSVTLEIEYWSYNNFCLAGLSFEPSHPAMSPPVLFTVLRVNADGSATVLDNVRPYWEHGRVQVGPYTTGCADRGIVVQMKVDKTSPPTTWYRFSNMVGPFGRDGSGRTCSDDRHGCPVPTNVGGPVNVGSGNMHYDEPLFGVDQGPLPFAFSLAFNSREPGSAGSPVGPRWTHSFAPRIVPANGFIDPRYATLTDGQGAQTAFKVLPTASGGPTTRAVWPGDSAETLTWTAAGADFVVTSLDGTRQTFRETDGLWKSTVDRWGNSLTATYSGTNLTRITKGPEGREWTLGYAGSLLTSVTDFDGNQWQLQYDGNGRLWKVAQPGGGFSPAWRTYEYDGAGLLNTVRDAGGAVLEAHEYDAAARCTSSWRSAENRTDAAARDVVTLEYETPAAFQTRVTTRLSATQDQTTVFTLDPHFSGRFLPTQIDGNCPSCPSSGADLEVFQWSADNHVLGRTAGRDLSGSGGVDERVRTDTTYDENGQPTKVVENATAALGAPSRATELTYGWASWPSFVTQRKEPSVKSGQQKTTTWTWNGSGETELTITQSGYLSPTASSTTSTTTKQTFSAGGTGGHRLLKTEGPAPGTGVPAGSRLTELTYYPDDDATPNRRGRLQKRSLRTSYAAGPVDTRLETTYDDYDVYGTARKVTDPNLVEETLSTDARGRVLTRTNKKPAGDATEPADYLTTYTYDVRDRLTQQELPRGHRRAFEYEEGTNRLLRTLRVAKNGAVHEQRERLALTLDGVGNRVTEEAQVCDTPAVSCSSWTARRHEERTYDAQNRLATTTVRDSSTETYTTYYTHDSRGNLTKVRDARHANPNTLYGCDGLNRLTQVVRKQPTPPVDPTTSYAYDVRDGLKELTDPNGNHTAWDNDDFGRVAKQDSPVTGITTYEYDAAGNPTKQSGAEGRVTDRTYDLIDRLLTAVSTRTGDPTETVTNVYDETSVIEPPSRPRYGKGRLTSTSDPSGSTLHSYDRRGLLRREDRTIRGVSSYLTYANDPDGNRGSIRYPSGRVVDTTFDFAGRPATVVSGATNYVSAVTYEPFGPEKTITYGNSTTWQMDWTERYLPKRLRVLGLSAGSLDTTYSLDPVGNVSGTTDASGTGYDRTYGYDDLDRLTTATGGESLWGTGSFTYDALGSRKTMSLGSRSVSYTYSGTTPLLTTVLEGASETSVTHDAVGNETAFGPVGSSYTPRSLLAATSGTAFVHDGRGVRVAEVATAATLFHSLTPCRAVDTRDPDGPLGGPALPASGSRAFSLWGVCGIPAGATALAVNVTSVAPSQPGYLTLYPTGQSVPLASTLNYKPGVVRANNAVASFSATGGLSAFNGSAAAAHYLLDVAGAFLPAGERHFFYSPELRLLSETQEARGGATPAALYEYVWLNGRPVAQEKVGDPSGLRYTVADHLGTPIAQTNAAGSFSWGVELEPFGRVWGYRNGSAADHQPLRFPGQEERQTHPGRSYNVFRWYRPDIGAYTQSDPIGVRPLELPVSSIFGGELGFSPGSSDELAFSYVNSNPLRLVDPLGLLSAAQVSCILAYGTAGAGGGFVLGGGLGAVTTGGVAAPPGAVAGAALGGLAGIFAGAMGCTDTCSQEFARADRWRCRARCAVYKFPGDMRVGYTEGFATGLTESGACKAAKKDASSGTPPGHRTKHCKCYCGSR